MTGMRGIVSKLGEPELCNTAGAQFLCRWIAHCIASERAQLPELPKPIPQCLPPVAEPAAPPATSSASS